jgi:hypothetical protein
MPVIAMQPFWQVRGALSRMSITSSVGPLAYERRSSKAMLGMPISRDPLAHRLAIGSVTQRHGTNCFAFKYRHNHSKSTCRRHQWGILMSVHSVLLARADGVATIGYFQLDRGDNVLRLNS